MNELFTAILNEIENVSVGWKIIILIFLLIIKIFAAIGIKNLIEIYRQTKTLKNIFNNNQTTKDKCIKTQNDLFNHPLFFTMTHLINHKIKLMDFGDKDRNKIFITLLEIKIKAVANNSKKLIEENNLSTLSKADFKALVFKSFSNIIDSYNSEMKERFGEQIYRLVMQHPEKGFNTWHETVVVYTKNLVKDICDSDIYENNIERMCAIFNSYHSAIDATLVNIEKTFYGFNGELDNIIRLQSHSF